MTRGKAFKRLLTAAVLVSAALLVAIRVPAATAAIYEVHACRLPNGAPAPAYGWAVTGSPLISMNCPGGTITVRTPPGTHGKGWAYGVHFDAPAGTTLTGVRRNVHSATGAVVGGAAPWHWGYTETGVIVGQSTPIAINSSSGGEFEHTFDEPFPARLSRFGFELICSSGQGGDCLDNGSSFVVRRVALQVDDATPPKIVQSSGSLLQTTGPQKGERHLALALRDVGGGLYMVRVDVDGEPMSQIPVDDNQGACRRPFLQPVPCKLAANVDVPVDTTQLTDGPHTIDVRVFDATGVNSAVVGPVSLLVDNEPDPLPRGTAGCPATNSAKLRRRSRPTVVRFGGSVLITGRVSGPRAVLRGARVGVVDNSSVAGPPSLAQLSGKGRFKIRVRPKQSTSIRPVLVSRAGEAQACGKPLSVKVRAGVRLTIRPRHLRNGESIRLGGRVLGRSRPARGKTVAVQARARGASAWTTVTLMRTNATGRFKFNYRFRKTFRTTTYEFRALVPRERGYPYLSGRSRARRATVSP